MDIRIDGDASFRYSYLDVEGLHPKKKIKKKIFFFFFSEPLICGVF